MFKDSTPPGTTKFFADSPDLVQQPHEPLAPWKVMIVDDDEAVHTMTMMVLQRFQFLGRHLHFISAYSGWEALALIKQHPDTALMILDVVMETEDAGLRLVREIREQLQNHMVRIVLRTGQPGQAPENHVIINYDINDYKEKTELTSQRFVTTVIAALRSYRDLHIIESNRQSLEKIIAASASIFKMQSLKKFSSACLAQLTSMLSINSNVIYCQAEGFAAQRNNGDFYILAGTGEFSNGIDRKIKEVLPRKILQDFELALEKKQSLHFDNHYIGYFRSQSGSENLIYIEGWQRLDALDKRLIDRFCTNISIAYENICRKQEIEDTEAEFLLTLGQAAETQAANSGFHTRRVAEYAKMLAILLGFSEEEADVLRLAAPLHDLGNLTLPYGLLQKSSPLTVEEWALVKSHPQRGYEILQRTQKPVIKMAALIALQHQEKFDGTGYPQGLKGEQIHLYARITTLADVFDVLSSNKPYRPAWELEKIFEFLREQQGKHFDPRLVDIFLEHLPRFLRIREYYTEALPNSERLSQ